MQSEDTWMELHVLRRHGWSIAALAREFGLTWRTAKRYATAGEPPRYRPRLRPAELSAAQLAHLERRLAVCPDLRTTVLLRELRDEYAYGGSYTSLRRRVVEPGLIDNAALDTRVAWVRDLMDRVTVDGREEHAVAIWRMASDDGVNRSDSVSSWLRR